MENSRRGSAILLAVVISAIVGISVLALWSGARTSTRTIALESAIAQTDADADSALIHAMAFADSGNWNRLPSPGDWQLVTARSSRGRTWRAEIARTAWLSLLLRGIAQGPGGVRGTRARADHRALVPLVAPFDFPAAALTGDRPWLVDAAATLDIPVAVGREHLCRASAGARGVAVAPLPPAIDSMRLPVVDPDTLRDSIVGVFRLRSGRLRTMLRARGIVVVDTDLSVEADLRLTGVLVARGSVHPAGGHLDITGAVLSGDVFGSASTLGPGDRVRYDACAIRRAVELVTSRGPTATWTILNVF